MQGNHQAGLWKTLPPPIMCLENYCSDIYIYETHCKVRAALGRADDVSSFELRIGYGFRHLPWRWPYCSGHTWKLSNKSKILQTPAGRRIDPQVFSSEAGAPFSIRNPTLNPKPCLRKLHQSTTLFRPILRPQP